MSKRKETVSSGFEDHDTLSNTGIDASLSGGEDDVSAAKVPDKGKASAPAFVSVQDTKQEIRSFDCITRARTEEIIKNRSLLAAGLGIVPIPIFNFASVTVIQIALVQSITRLYNIEVKKSWIKNIIASVLGGLATTGISGAVARGLGTAPLVGTSLAVLSTPVLNGLTTYAVGYMFVRYFESSDGFLKTNTKAMGDWFTEGFNDGREKLGGVIAGKVRAT
ncbi:MAG: YcjF family protein [Treponema sp.]|jgi:uncharacterized protein (DUF697 family)|nr:YcjF family protein [Treponema sp.]